MALKVRTKILKSILNVNGSQCKAYKEPVKRRPMESYQSVRPSSSLLLFHETLIPGLTPT